jgi:chromosome segregation ATPase
MSNIPEQYSYLFEDIEVEVGVLYASDKAIHDLTAVVAERESQLSNYDEALKGYKQQILDIEVEMAELRGKLKSADAHMRSVQGLITQFNYREDTKERQLKDAKARITRRKAYILRQEVQRRLKTIGKQIIHNKGQRAARGYKEGRTGSDIIPL